MIVGISAVRTAASLSAAWVVVCLGVIIFQAVRNPMDARAAALDERLTSMVTFTDGLPDAQQAPLWPMRIKVIEKKSLWTELVAAPPPPPPAAVDPNLQEKIKEVRATRQTIASKDGVTVKIYVNAEDKRGEWKKVGDTVNGLTIVDIRPDVVIFGTKQGDREYTVELPRR